MLHVAYIDVIVVKYVARSAESYLDPTKNTFDRSLLHNYAEWEPLVPNFNYHGLNTYAYILDRYGISGPSNQRTFDFVTIQLYEGYSHAEYNTTILKQSPAEYVNRWVQKVLAGWVIDYSADTELLYPHVNQLVLDRTQLVVGLANGWAGDGKFFLMYPDEVCLYLILRNDSSVYGVELKCDIPAFIADRKADYRCMFVLLIIIGRASIRGIE